ncbi:uncharacterized protein BP5553_00096 [Venustampulla echinocandica]|uniref:F-box domain-containing protein n=1 Tax=Venustampulla echinocandica TaxID=2656787 RepID=A0A370TX72_9HELO|nr:uncharacterized protein BP5553_00096 [Venustampulla echinocandica]RDL40117.1 hypothetical protein BP5553_00096 [Venustampulla echinocandica]
MPTYFCPLCGVWMRGILPPRPDATVQRFEWFEELRVVCSANGAANPYLTGVCFGLRGRMEIAAPPNSRAKYNDSGVSMDRYQLYYSNNLFWVFSLHEACWRLFSLQTSGSEEVDSGVVNCLFRLLLSASVDAFGHLSFRQDVGGANNFRRPYNNPMSRCSNTAWSLIFADPHQYLDLIEPGSDTNDIETIETFSAHSKCGGYISLADCFTRLPNELIHEILINLSSWDVTRARLASRAIARASTIGGLRQEFWRSRFSANFEMGFAFSPAVKLRPSLDWHRRYFAEEDMDCDNSDHTSGSILLRARRLQGINVSGAEFNSTSLYRDPFLGLNVRQAVSGNLNGDNCVAMPRPHRRGCRELEVKSIPIPASTRGVPIGISTVVFDNRTYIPGLRVFNVESELATNPSAMGLIIRENESECWLRSVDDPYGVEVAVVSTGIISLRFITGNDVDQMSGWFGEPPTTVTGVGFSRLFAQDGQRICGFMAGFDVLNFIRRKDGMEKGFPIDGPGGERIVRVDVKSGNLNDAFGIHSLTARTGSFMNVSIVTRRLDDMSPQSMAEPIRKAINYPKDTIADTLAKTDVGNHILATSYRLDSIAPLHDIRRMLFPALHDPTLMQPPIGRTWLVPQLIPWEDQTSTGTIDRIQSITAYSHADLTLSLRFKYASRKTHHIGPTPHVQQSTSTEPTFSDNETIIHLETGCSWKGLHEVSGGLLGTFSKNITGGFFHLMWKSTVSKLRDIYFFCAPFALEGFWPGYPTNYPNNFECAFAHMNPKNINGKVTLKSANPQDTPEINLGFFSKGNDDNLQAMFEAAKFARGIFSKIPANTFKEMHPCTQPGCTDEDQKDYLRTQIYSHHATSSAAIGADDDPMAVLDSKFRVRGVDNLRVVDGSAFPRVPGAFPVIPTFMISEKAAEEILAAAT